MTETEQDRLEFLKAMQLLGATFDRQITDRLLDAYFHALSDLPIELLTAATSKWLLVGRFFPKPVELRELCEGSADDRAQMAWDVIIRAVKRFGGWVSVFFEDPLIAHALADTWGDWARLCDSLPLPGEPMFVSDQKRFLAAYRLAEMRGGKCETYFPGRAEIANRQNVGAMLQGAMGSLEYYQLVGVVARSGEMHERRLTFSRETGMLTAVSQQALTGQQRQALIAGDVTRLIGKTMPQEAER